MKLTTLTLMVFFSTTALAEIEYDEYNIEEKALFDVVLSSKTFTGRFPATGYISWENSVISGNRSFLVRGKELALEQLLVRGDVPALRTAQNSLYFITQPYSLTHILDKDGFWDDKKLIIQGIYHTNDTIVLDRLGSDHNYTLQPRWVADSILNGDPLNAGSLQIISEKGAPLKTWTNELASRARKIFQYPFKARLVQDKIIFKNGFAYSEVVPENHIGKNGYKCRVNNKNYARINGQWVLDHSN